MSSLSGSQWDDFRSYFTVSHSREDLIQYDYEKGKKSNISHIFWANKPAYVAELLTYCDKLYEELRSENPRGRPLNNLQTNMATMLDYLVEIKPEYVEDERIATIFQKLNSQRREPMKPMETEVILGWCKSIEVAKEAEIEPRAVPTCWEIFGTTEEIADQGTVRRRYLQLCKEIHPDKLTRDDPLKKLKEEAFKLVKNAYQDMCRIKKWRS